MKLEASGVTRQRAGTSSVMAVLAALLLVLHMLGAAHAVGATASGAQHDVFGNPLCLAGHVAPEAPAGEGLPGCCILGCGFALGLLAPPPPQALAPDAHALDASAARPLPVFQVAAKAHDPGAPRAPPALN